MNIADVLKGLPAGLSVRDAFELMSEQDPALWCAYKRRLNGAPLTFNNEHQLTAASLADLRAKNPEKYDKELYVRLLKHRPMLIDPLRDQHPELIIEKGRQAGVSEVAISKAIAMLDKKPSSKQTPKLIYTFPRNPQLLDYSNTRIAPIFRETPRAAALLTGSNGVMSKKIGRGFLILRSAWESGLGEGVDADAVFLDEFDRMKPGVDVAFRESLSSSEWNIFCILSTPTLPKKGIDEFFQKSDQRVWLVRCSRCSLEQEVTYADNVVQVQELPVGSKEVPEGSFAYVCKLKKCQGPLDRLHGRYVARYPERKDARGYHIPQTIMPWISASALQRKRVKYKFFQLFCNYSLGITSKGDNVFLTDEDFEEIVGTSEAFPYGYPMISRRTRDWSRVVVGIDWGHMNWVVVMGISAHNDRPYILAVDYFEDDAAQELASVYAIENFIKPFEPDMILADSGYGKDRNAYLKRKFATEGGREFYAVFTVGGEGQTSRNVAPVWAEGKVTVDKTMAYKLTARAIKEKEFGIPSLENRSIALLRDHFKNLALLRQQANEDDENSEIVEHIAASGDDHLASATVFAWLGIEKLSAGGDLHFSFD